MNEVLTAEKLVELASRVVVIRGYLGPGRSMNIHLVTALTAGEGHTLIWGNYYEALKVGDHLNDRVKLDLVVGNDSLAHDILREWERMCVVLLAQGDVVVSDGCRAVEGVDKTLHFIMACARIQALVIKRAEEKDDDPYHWEPTTALLWRRLSALIGQRTREFESFSDRLISPFARGLSYPLSPRGHRT